MLKLRDVAALQVGTSACVGCPVSAVTLSTGASSVAACGCPVNYFGNGKTVGCSPCPSGSTGYSAT